MPDTETNGSHTSPTFDVMVSGHLCLDILPDLGSSGQVSFAERFLPGRLVTAGPVTFSTGGAVSNTGLALAKLGVSTRLNGKVGDDPFGQIIRKIVASKGSSMDEGIIIDPAVASSYSIVINYPGVDRIFMHYSGANDNFQSSDVPYYLLDRARLFHFGYPPVMRSVFSNNGKELIEVFRRAKKTGVTTSMDMSLPDASSEAARLDWCSILRNTLPYVDIFIPSIEEILFLLRGEVYQELRRASLGSDILPLISPLLLSDLASELLTMGPKIVGLKLGDRGMYLRTSNRRDIASIGRARPDDPEKWSIMEFWAPCFKVLVAGTTGAGDATTAGFLAGLLRDLPVEQTLTMAVAVGACSVEASDAVSGIRSWEETSQRITEGWERIPLNLSAPGWYFDRPSGLWRGPCV